MERTARQVGTGDGADPAGGDEAPSDTRLMRGVKLALVVMGVLILAGFGAIGFEIYRRTTDTEYRAQLEQARAGRAGPTATTVSGTPLLLPEGAVITGTVAVGSRLALTVEMLDGTQILYFVNPSQNDVLEFLRTRPADPAVMN